MDKNKSDEMTAESNALNDDDPGLDFYCPKCYDMVNYFMDESSYYGSCTSKLTKLYKVILVHFFFKIRLNT